MFLALTLRELGLSSGVGGPVEFLAARDAHSRNRTHVPLSLARFCSFSIAVKDDDIATRRGYVVVFTAHESEQTLSVQRYMRLKILQLRSSV